jgi:hypothetical protein
MRLQQAQKQQMSFVKKATIIGGTSLVIAIAAFIGIKFSNVEESTAAKTYTWTGSVNSDWNNKKNWSGGKTPKKGSNIEIATFTNAPVIDRNSNFKVNDLSLTDGATLELNANLEIDGDITLGEECEFIIKKGTADLDGALIVLGKDAKVKVKGGKLKVGSNLLLVSSNDADSTYCRVSNGELEIKGETYFLRKNSGTDAAFKINGGAVKIEETEKEMKGYDKGRILFLVSGGDVDFEEDLFLEKNSSSSSSSFTPTPSSPCDDATAWDKNTTYNRKGTQKIYITHKSKTYRMKAKKYWSKNEEPGSGKGEKVWEEIKDCKDYCELASEWESKKEYERKEGGDEVYVSYKGEVYELAYDVWWSQNHQPDKSSKYWTKIKKCSEYSAPTCGSVQQWNSSTAYKRNSASDIIEVFWDGKVYRMKTNKWWSQNDEPGKTGKIWQYNRDCKGGSSSSSSAIGRDSLGHTGGVITFHKKWRRPPGFKSSNTATIKFKYKSEKLKLQKNDQYVNLEVDKGVVLDVEGNVFVKGDLKVEGTCSGTSVINMNGTSKQKISGGGQIANITINNDNDVALENDIVITGELTLTEGDIELGDYDITLEGDVPHGNADSYLKINGSGVVKAEVGSEPVIFPIGRNPYEPIIIDEGGGAVYEVGVRDFVYENPASESIEITTESVSETWFVRSDESKTNVQITFGWNADQELSGFDRTKSFVAYWEEGVSASWTPSSIGVATGDGPYYRTITLSNMSTNQYYFGIGSGNSALPVEFTYFKADEQNGSVELTWGTATETNNELFEVQRSSDGVTWEVLEEVMGAGTTFEPQDYITYDNSPLSGVNYYRLRQVDFDDKFDFSKVAIVDLGASSGANELEITSVYPNPFSSNLSIDVAGLGSGRYSVEILNTSGVAIKSREFSSGESAQFSGLDDLQFGVYILKVVQGEKVVTKQIVKR